MKTHIRLATLVAPLALLAVPASAADAIIYDEPASQFVADPVAGGWSGFYIGGQLGYGFGSTGTLQLSPFTPALQTAFAPGFSGGFNGSITGGIHAGYDWQFGNMVVGGILDVSAMNLSDSQNAYSVPPARYTITRELDYLATLRARIGVATSDRFMVYATGGLAYGKVDFSYEQPGSGAVTTVSGGQNNNFGYTVGAGVTGKVTQNLSLGLEYLYTDLGGNDFQANLSGGPFSPSTIATGSDRRFDFHTVQIRASYHF